MPKNSKNKAQEKPFDWRKMIVASLVIFFVAPVAGLIIGFATGGPVGAAIGVGCGLAFFVAAGFAIYADAMNGDKENNPPEKATNNTRDNIAHTTTQTHINRNMSKNNLPTHLERLQQKSNVKHARGVSWSMIRDEQNPGKIRHASLFKRKKKKSVADKMHEYIKSVLK